MAQIINIKAPQIELIIAMSAAVAEVLSALVNIIVVASKDITHMPMEALVVLLMKQIDQIKGINHRVVEGNKANQAIEVTDQVQTQFSIIDPRKAH